jgi:hypothetical protein
VKVIVKCIKLVRFIELYHDAWSTKHKEEVLLRVKEQRDILHEISKRKANWIGHFSVDTAFYNRLLKER